MASIRDVAALAGVSTATVARVLRGTAPVSEALARRVKWAVSELDYVPNAVARGLSRGRSNLVGLLVPDISNPFFAEVTRGLEEVAAQHDYHVLVSSSDLHAERESELVRVFESRTVDAVAFTPSATTAPHLRRLRKAGVPLAFVDRRVTDVAAPTVRTDNKAAAHQAVRYLLELGHRRIAMLGGPPAFATAVERLEGFTAAMREAGVRVGKGLVRQGFLGIDGGYQAMASVLDTRPRPTAVFSFNNLLAVGALGALRDRGVRVPEGISLVTFDDMSLFPYVDPPITAIAQPAYEMGVETGRLLFAMLDRPDRTAEDYRDIVLPTDFRIRASCAPPQ